MVFDKQNKTKPRNKPDTIILTNVPEPRVDPELRRCNHRSSRPGAPDHEVSHFMPHTSATIDPPFLALPPIVPHDVDAIAHGRMGAGMPCTGGQRPDAAVTAAVAAVATFVTMAQPTAILIALVLRLLRC